jgi:hypothetical protein
VPAKEGCAEERDQERQHEDAGKEGQQTGGDEPEPELQMQVDGQEREQPAIRGAPEDVDKQPSGREGGAGAAALTAVEDGQSKDGERLDEYAEERERADDDGDDDELDENEEGERLDEDGEDGGQQLEEDAHTEDNAPQPGESCVCF